jgi:hypothetical protein
MGERLPSIHIESEAVQSQFILLGTRRAVCAMTLSAQP